MNDLPAFAIDSLLVGKTGAAEALRLRDATYSYEELNLLIGRLAAFLRAEGAQPGDRVASWSNKGFITCLMPLAAPRAGLVHVPVNPLLKGAQVGHILADSGAKLLIGHPSRLKLLGEEDLPAGCALHEEKAVEAALSGHDPLPPREHVDTDELAAILYTSGSTGRPKGVMLSHANLSLGAISVAEYTKLAADDVTLAVLPLSFDYGQNQLLSTWHAGGCVVPLDYLTPRDVIKACAKHGVTTLAAVPPLWVQLVEQDWPAEATHAMRRLTNSGGALTVPLVRGLRSLFPNADLYAMYGLTEAFRSTYLDPALVDERPTCMGKAIPHAEILVIGKDGEPTDADEPGELVHCGPLVAQGYWQDAKRTAERFKPAPACSRYGGMAVWSGDTVKRDADGYLYFVGRDDAMIKVSGNRVSPTEVEEEALASGIVAEACAIGRKDERLGEAILLYVRAKDAADEDALVKHMKSALPAFMQPADYVWLDAFPKNPNGKIDRNRLVAEMAEKVDA